MVIGEQLNHQQAQQQIVAATNHRTTTSSSQNNHIHSATSNLPGQNTLNINEGPNNNNNIINISTSNNLGGSSNSNHNNGNISIGGLVGGGTSVAVKNQIEILHTMREALFSQDGWGCQHVNQDTNWEVPSSPEPTNKDPSSGPTIWKPTINNGTDLWESNLRNGGQPPAQSIQKTPWGHTPSSNLGGTWGEDDDGADSTSVWTGASNNPAATGNVGNVVGVVGTAGVGGSGAPNTAQQWGQGAVGVGVGATSSANVNVPGGGGTNAGVTGTGVGATGNGWGDPRELRSGPMGGSIDIRSVDPRDSMRAASAGDPRDLRILDPRDPIRGDPRGISGRLNGTSEMWGHQHSITHNQMSAMNKMVGPGGVGGSGTNVGAAVVAGSAVTSIGPTGVVGNVVGNVNAQWAAAQTVVGPKDINSIGGKQVSGWEEPSPPPQRRNIQNYDDGTSLWGQQSRVPGGGSHWKEISDPMNRSHLIRSTINSQNTPNPGVVPGLSGSASSGLGNQTGGIGGTPSGIGVSGNPNPMVGPQGRLTTAIGPGGVGGQHKPDATMWVHPNNAGVGGRNTASGWGDDSNHNVGATPGSNWVDDKTSAGIGQIGANVVGGGNSWNDAPNSWNKAQNKISSGAGSWGTGGGANDGSDLSNDWAMHSGIVGKPQQKLNSGVNVNVGALAPNIDIIKQSKQYRILVDTGFKKDDIERALMSSNMNIQEAAEILHPNAMDSWRRHDETLGSYADHPNSNNAGGFPGRYPTAGAQPTMSFPPNNHMLNNMSGSAIGAGANNPNLAAINAMQPLQVQKYLAQAPHNVAGGGGAQSVNPVAAVAAFGQSTASVNVGAANTNNQPSAQQLRMLVQQIQLAVHSGYLSSQILNQPLAPATLLLLNQLLSNIKHLQGAQQSLSRSNNANTLQLNVTVAKYKQQIQNLQSQINAQQAIYIKQQQQQQQHSVAVTAAHVNNSNTEYLRGQHDAISALQGNFSEINLNKPGYQGAPNQQSRLNQWKLPVLEKDMTTDSTDFSRAPGATKQSLSASNANNMGPLGLQNDGTWSAGRNIGDGWPESSNDNESKDWSVAQPTSATAYTDLVQEFEPGKPWKGSQIKSIEDDPSITPGSVARSPLSINPTPKEADIFSNAGKNSPTDLPTLSLSSSTWSFNPSSSNQNFPSWSDNPQQCPTSELWATPMNKTSRGPPPGLGTNKGAVTVTGVSSVTNPSSVVSGNSNGWLVASSCSGGGVPSTNANWSGTNSSWNSNWLLLKNLTAQIDGSTLRTLCIQHGPLVSFHLFLNQGIALCKYATREEANKAQMTLNNCVLGNTTICAESPNENEVQNILQHLPQANPASAASNGSSNNSGNNGGGNNTSNGNTNNGSGNGNSNTGGNGNSLVNGTCNSGNNATNGANTVGAVNLQSVNACNTNGGNNAGNNSSSTGNNSNNVSAGGTNSSNVAWRQIQNQQQNQSRPARETDFDYISKFVCSIVDD